MSHGPALAGFPATFSLNCSGEVFLCLKTGCALSIQLLAFSFFSVCGYELMANG